MIPLLVITILIPRSLDPKGLKDATDKPNPLVVRFLSQHTPGSVKLNKDFEKFTQMYKNIQEVKVAYVNCGKFHRLCLKEGVWQSPAVHLYQNHTITEYEGGMSYESLAEWTRKYTGVQGTFLHFDLLSPNNRTFHELLSHKKCVFTMFHAPSCAKCKRFLSEMAEIARAFHLDDNVSVCEIDVDKFKSFYFDFKVSQYPTFNMFVDGDIIKYDGELKKLDMIDFINDYCGTYRSENGMLSEEAGVIDEVSPIIQNFMRHKSPKYISEMKEIPKTEYYVELMGKILHDGIKFLYSERSRISEIISQKSADQAILDKLKIRANILSHFIEYIDNPVDNHNNNV